MKNNFILFNQLTTSVYQLEIQSTTYTKRWLKKTFQWVWLYIFIAYSLVIKKTNEGGINYVSLIPLIFMLILYIYFVIIGIREAKYLIVKLRVDLNNRTFDLNYLEYNSEKKLESNNLDKLQIRVIENGLGYYSLRNWKMEFLLEKKRIFTQYSIDEQWTPEKFKQLASEIKLLKEKKCT
jgi:hypothetical protein